MAGEMQKLKTFAVLLVVVGVALTIGLKVTGEVKSNMLIDNSVDNETFNATSDPYNYTVAEAGDSDFNKLESATVYDTTSQSSELTATIVDAEAGKVEVEGATDTGDESIDYQYTDDDTQAQSGADDAISGLTEVSGFLPIIGLVIAAAVVIGLVSGGFGGGRRGRV